MNINDSNEFFYDIISHIDENDSDRAIKDLVHWLLRTKNIPPFFPDKESALMFYWNTHPRFSFFKTIAHNAALLDVGAGSGAMASWREWLHPVRNDIRCYANDLEKGEFFDNCEGYFVHNLSEKPLDGYSEYFDSIMSCHVLEHVQEWDPFFDNMLDTLKPGGTLFLEWPTIRSQSLPSMSVFLDAGVKTSTVNFYDDSTHIHTADIPDVLPLLTDREMKVMSTGIIQNTFMGAELLKTGAKTNDMELNLYGLWITLGFSQYITATKVGNS